MNNKLLDNTSHLLTSDATEQLDKAEAAIFALGSSLVDTVDSLDQYLNSVADTFTQRDNEIAQGIDSGSSMYRYKGRDKFVQSGKTSKEKYYNAKMYDLSQLP